ncbi:ABC transporter ATP-binding protein [Acetobacterium carbinolicum]|jgi:simple sugar transport system ATP-binding protein|uniref:ABC transporter ATP-binding protein n=1 Tax=Acetobacterium TaxID=33951 RepID=UPI000DBEAD99|nr:MULTISPECIES: ABC transporter ATP-binding protein [unclassified Acetobacterium]AWW26522.1 ABC transporter ATP-binding protein [Acetobacterium sp. KB-1]MDZ5724759.1 ABC transporter ATP-binding protein [Acetobacterium sp. K1/6]
MNNDYVVKMENITKVFGKVKALDHVEFSLKKGEVHAILGENGAGKSSLMNVLNGIYMPDEGQIEVKGQRVSISSPKIALDLGIGMLPQHYKLVDAFSAMENVAAGSRKTTPFLNKKKILDEMGKLIAQLGMDINPNKKVYEMSVAEKQSLEIFKVLYRGADILILDEPTAVLTPQEIKNLFEIVKKMVATGCSVIIITHKLEEVMEISDRITIMRKGTTIQTVNKAETTPQELAGMMVGDMMELNVPYVAVKRGEKALEVKDITAIDRNKVNILDHVSFDLYAGEILGVAGIAGSGQKELCESIAGLYHIKSGEIIFEGENIVGKNPEKISQMGISLSFVPEDRLGMGLVSSMDIIDNVLLKDYRNKKGLGISRVVSRDKAEALVERLNVSTPAIENHAVSLLSGGNIQKVLLGREIELEPKLMVTAYATRGLDVGSSQIIYELLNEQKVKMKPIIYVGEDLDVLMSLCDRILVICEGRVTGIVDPRKTTKEAIGLMMSGVISEGEQACSIS